MKTAHIKVRDPNISGAPKYRYTARYVYRNGKLVNVTDLTGTITDKKLLTGGAHGTHGAHQNG